MWLSSHSLVDIRSDTTKDKRNTKATYFMLMYIDFESKNNYTV